MGIPEHFPCIIYISLMEYPGITGNGSCIAFFCIVEPAFTANNNMHYVGSFLLVIADDFHQFICFRICVHPIASLLMDVILKKSLVGFKNAIVTFHNIHV